MTLPDEWEAHLLIAAREGEQVRRFPVALPCEENRELVIGRSRSLAVTLHDEHVSQKHLKVYWREGRHWVEDLGSRHGTTIRGQRLQSPTALASGDVISLGRSTCEYVLQKRPAETPPGDQPASTQAVNETQTSPGTAASAGATRETLAGATRVQVTTPPPAKPSQPAPRPVPTPAKPRTGRAASAGLWALAFAAIAAALAVVCYFAWQLFHPGASP